MAHRRWQSMPHPTIEGRSVVQYQSPCGTAYSSVEVDTEPLMQGDGRGTRVLIAHVLRDLRRSTRLYIKRRAAAASIPPLSALFPGLGKAAREKTALEKIGFMHRGS